MATKDIQKTMILKSFGWFMALLGLMMGIFSCYQYFRPISNYGFAFGVTFVTIVVSLILLSFDLPNIKIKKIGVKTIKNLIFFSFIIIDVLLFVFTSDGTFSIHAFVLFIGMILAAIILKLEKEFIEKRKKLLGLIFIGVEIILVLVVVLAIPDPGNWLYYIFLVYGIGGIVGWDTLQSIFWKQKLRSIILLGVAIVLGWIYGITMVVATLSWTNLLGPIFVTLGLFLVLYLETQMRKQKLLVYVK
ncbi:MAG: hypothetical protein RBG13Loki_1232 [Promethearchaeota archaeon CR_4]|nr:MAG: hypothetical protein RBG13Loki_1232 [Candidatus Lokiarchaeota archaeon CR_4]